MAFPGRGADEFEGGFLERARHEEAVHDLEGAQPFQDRPPGGQCPDPQAGRSDLGEGADVDDDPVRVVGGERFGQRSGVAVDEAAGEVVLDHEGAGRPGGPHHLFAASGREDRTGRVLEERLADEDPCPGGPERGFEQVGADSVGVDRHGHRPQPGRVGDGQQSGVRR